MKKQKLRLLVTNKCTRNCAGCCNNDVKPSGAIYIEDLKKIDWTIYEKILITGGEPLLFPKQTRDLILSIKKQDPASQITLYTAIFPVICWDDMVTIFENLDGVTFTIHDVDGIRSFIRLNKFWLDRPELNTKISKRLNIFCDVPLFPLNCYGWDVKFIEWIKNCPLPEDEIFLRLDKLFEDAWL